MSMYMNRWKQRYTKYKVGESFYSRSANELLIRSGWNTWSRTCLRSPALLKEVLLYYVVLSVFRIGADTSGRWVPEEVDLREERDALKGLLAYLSSAKLRERWLCQRFVASRGERKLCKKHQDANTCAKRIKMLKPEEVETRTKNRRIKLIRVGL